MTSRTRLVAALLVATTTALAGCAVTRPSAAPTPVVVPDLSAPAALLLGVAELEPAHDTGSGRVGEHRSEERLAHASVLELLLVGLLLDQVSDNTAANLLIEGPGGLAPVQAGAAPAGRRAPS